MLWLVVLHCAEGRSAKIRGRPLQPCRKYATRRSRRSRFIKLLRVKLHDALHTLITATLAETKVQANTTTGSAATMATDVYAAFQSHLLRAPRCCCQSLGLVQPGESHHTTEPVRLVCAQRAARMCTPCLKLYL